MKYDFSELSDIEFEELVNKLLTGKNSIVEQYSEGKDGGVDGVTRSITKGTTIQVKHYQKSGFSALKSTINNTEIDKIKKLKCNSYLLATSIDLSRQQAEELRNIILQVAQDVIIVGYEVLKNLLDNDFDTLKSTVKLWAINANIVRQILKPECESRFIELQARWQDINKLFVETPDVQKVIEILNKEHVAIIAGNPGVGKTTLAEYLCFCFFKEGFDIQLFEGDFSRENYDLSNHDKKVLYYFDDFLGSNYLNCISDKSDTAIVNFINLISKEKNKRFILTSRINIINKAYAYSQAFQNYKLNKKNYVVNVGAYNEMTKGKILYNHLWHSNILLKDIGKIITNKYYKEIIRHRNFNPRLIRFITEADNLQDSNLNYLEFVKKSLDQPTQIWEQCFTSQLNDSQRLIVKLVVANGGKIDEPHLQDAYIKAFDLLKLQRPPQESCDYEYVLRICIKSILNKDIDYNSHKSSISVFNPSVSDYIIPKLTCNKNELCNVCQALQSVENVRFIESQNIVTDTKIQIYSSLLSMYRRDEWNEVKILLIGLLNRKDLLLDFINDIRLYYYFVTRNNASILFKWVINTITEIDWSVFLDWCCNRICGVAEEYYEIYEAYSNCPFVDEDVLETIHNNMVDEIPNYFEDEIRNSDSFYKCNTEQKIEVLAKSILDSLQLDIPIISDDDIREILGKIDYASLAEENKVDYEDNEIEIPVRRTHSIDIDRMFARLLEKN